MTQSYHEIKTGRGCAIVNIIFKDHNYEVIEDSYAGVTYEYDDRDYKDVTFKFNNIHEYNAVTIVVDCVDTVKFEIKYLHAKALEFAYRRPNHDSEITMEDCKIKIVQFPFNYLIRGVHCFGCEFSKLYNLVARDLDTYLCQIDHLLLARCHHFFLHYTRITHLYRVIIENYIQLASNVENSTCPRVVSDNFHFLMQGKVNLIGNIEPIGQNVKEYLIQEML